MTCKTDFVFTVKLLSDTPVLQRKSIGGKWKLLQILGARTVYFYNLGLIITIIESIFPKVKEKNNQVRVQDISLMRQTAIILLSFQTLFLKKKVP